jgi:hypothetical protein
MSYTKIQNTIDSLTKPEEANNRMTELRETQKQLQGTIDDQTKTVYEMSQTVKLL